MASLPEDIWVTWKRKRRSTFIGFLIVMVVVGLDTSVILITLPRYLKNLVHTDHLILYYSLILGFFSFSSIISSVICGRWLDKGRKVRWYVNVILGAEIIGYVMYAIPYHPLFPLAGRMFSGISKSFGSVVSGEIFRIYNEEKATSRSFLLTASFLFGVSLGPIFNIMFRDVDFNLGGMMINYLNFVPIFMAALVIVTLVCVNFLVHDCSAEIDFKEYLKHRSGDGGEGDNETDGESSFLLKENSEVKEHADIRHFIYKRYPTIPIQKVLKTLFSNPNTILIFLATFVFMYTTYSMFVLLPLIVQINLKWNLSLLSIIYIIFGVFSFIVILVFSKFLNSNRSVYYTSLLSIIAEAVAFSLLILLNLLERKFSIDMLLIIANMVFLTVGWFFDGTLLRVTLAKMVPSRIQCFTESLRSAVGRVAIIIASFTAPNMLPWLSWWSGVIIIIVLLILGCFIIRREYLIEPK